MAETKRLFFFLQIQFLNTLISVSNVILHPIFAYPHDATHKNDKPDTHAKFCGKPNFYIR